MAFVFMDSLQLWLRLTQEPANKNLSASPQAAPTGLDVFKGGGP